MWYIIKVQGTVGNGEVMAVYSSNVQPSKINAVLKPELLGYGMYSSIQYLEQFAVSSVNVSNYKIERVVMLDEMI